MAGETVTVACKLPHGLKLRVFTETMRPESVMGGGTREVKVWDEIPDVSFTVFGNSHPQNKAPKCLIVGDYALTPNCPKELWDLWLQQNKDSDVVRNGLIFAHAKDQAAQLWIQVRQLFLLIEMAGLRIHPAWQLISPAVVALAQTIDACQRSPGASAALFCRLGGNEPDRL